MTYAESNGRVFALQLVVVQIILTGLLTLSAWLLGDHDSNQGFKNQIAFAVLCGGVICTLANIWFAIVTFRFGLGKKPEQILATFYMGEAGKFIITAALFIFVFKKFMLFQAPNNAFFLFAAFMIVQSTVWIYPLVRRKLYAGLTKINRR